MKAIITRNMTVTNAKGEAEAFEKGETPIELDVDTYRRLNRAGAAVVHIDNEPTGEDDKNLEKLNKTELLARATELTIEVDPKWTKADLIDAINKKEAEAAN
jgi:hypothetical protein